jgi:tetratricopeptide (TPR) repeat protein
MRSHRIGILALVLLSAPAASQTVQTWDGTDRVFRSLPPTPALDSAHAAFAAGSQDPAAYIELARAQAGVRQFREAVATLTEGLRRFPDDAELLRWRGHRYINLREFERAALDLERGLLIDSTLYGLWYHVGVLKFLREEYDDAATAFTRARPLAPDAGEAAGSTDWLWLSMRMLSMPVEARNMLARTPPFRGVNNAYTRRLELYAGRVNPRGMLTAADTADTQRATLAFGTAAYLFVEGPPNEIPRFLREAVSTTGWPAFGFIGAERMLTLYGRYSPSTQFAGRYFLWPAVYPADAREAACYAQIPPDQRLRGNLSVRLSPFVRLPHHRVRQLLDEYGARVRTVVEARRRQATGRVDSLPDAAPRLDWLDAMHSESYVLLSRDGRTSLEPAPQRAPSDSAFAFLSELVEEVRQLPLPSQTWGPELPTDTVVFLLRLAAPIATEHGLEDIQSARVSIPVATLEVPVRRPWSMSSTNESAFRNMPRRPDGFPRELLFEFIVDENGQPDSASTRILNVPRTNSRDELLEYDRYQALAAANFRRMRYTTGSIGGCKTRAWGRLTQTHLTR